MAIMTLSESDLNRRKWLGPIQWLALFIISFISFYVLDLQALWMGDDLGYMFTDSSLHKGDGNRVNSVSDILATQANHWTTCNGRFLIHSVVQLFVSLLGKDIFCAVNSLMFALLVLLTVKLSLPNKSFGLGSGLAVAVALWILLPRPGVTMLSLASYAINYLWTGVIILCFLIFWRAIEQRRVHRAGYFWGCLFAVFAGGLQESYSVPVSAALILWWLVQGKKATAREISVIICFVTGTIMVCFAPGNFVHAAQGGGVSPQALMNKLSLLGKDLIFSPLNYLAIALVVWWLAKPLRCGKFCKENITLLAAVCAALVLACVSYTAVRQLFAPSLFCVIIFVRMLVGPRVSSLLNSWLATIGMAAIYSGIIFGAHEIRKYPAKISQSVVHQATKGNRVIYIPENKSSISGFNNWLFDRYNDNPVTGKDLHIVFDSYTKKGLSRLYSPKQNINHITTIIPVSQTKLENSSKQAKSKGQKIYPVELIDGYSCFRVKSPGNKSNVKVRSVNGKHFSYERIYSNGYIYYVVPEDIKCVTTAPRKKCNEAKYKTTTGDKEDRELSGTKQSADNKDKEKWQHASNPMKSAE